MKTKTSRLLLVNTRNRSFDLKMIMSLFITTISFFNVSAQEKPQIKMTDFIGINSNVAAYDQKYLPDLAKCAKWMREYHSWGHYEVSDNYYKWDNITTVPQGYTWPDHNKFMDQCKALGINVLVDVLGKPEWAGTERGAYSKGDGTKAVDYMDKLEFMGQLVARYGSAKYDKSVLETADKVSGLNYIKYYEDDNEPDYTWETPQWPAEKYAVYCNAVHDGYGVNPSEDYPLLGIKSVDSTAMHVLGGLASNTISYLQKVLAASNGRIPFDVINVHTYCTDSRNGYSPENESYGLEKNLATFMNWCKTTLPGVPVWLTEFGWDTYLNGSTHSYVYAPKEQQANYIVRSYFIALKIGFEKAFLFMDKDPDSDNTLQYSSSGIIADQASGLAKKPSFYYLATLQNTIGEAAFKRVISYRELVGGNEVFCFEFINPQQEVVYVLWSRLKGSKTDSGTTLAYLFDLGYQPEYARVVTLKDKDTDGETTDMIVNGNKVLLTLTETPQFVVVPARKTALKNPRQPSFGLQVFPNPASDNAEISFLNPEIQQVKVTVYSPDGRPEKILNNSVLTAGHHNFSFPHLSSSGLYFVRVTGGKLTETKKIVFSDKR